MTIEIRRVRPDELGESVEALTAAFLERPDIDAVVERAEPRAGTWTACWVAHDGERVCGTFRSWATEITVPGGARLPAAAVSGVTVLPTHRRRGILRGMVAAEHAAIRERGEAMALLHAAEYPIYGRFGYGPGTLEATWTLDTRAAAVVPPASGRVEYVVPGPDSLALIRDVYERYRVGQPGEIRRMDYRWEGDLGMTPGRLEPGLEGLPGPPSRRGRHGRRLRPLQPHRGPLGRQPAVQCRHPRRAARADDRRLRHALAVPRGDGLGRDREGAAPGPRRGACRGCWPTPATRS